MSAYYTIGTNRAGLTVRVDVAPKPITDAAERFAALLVERDNGYTSPCRIWNGSSLNFNMGDGRIVNYKRAAIELAGGVLVRGARLKEPCGTPGCIEHLRQIEPKV